MKGETRQREPLPRVSEQMKAWSMALSGELSDWPQVVQKSFFGFTALYRDKRMFALLPRTRSIFKSNAVAFRINSANRSLPTQMEDPRIAAFDKDKAHWFTFELSSDGDLHDALQYLGSAFEAARITHKKK